MLYEKKFMWHYAHGNGELHAFAWTPGSEIPENWTSECRIHKYKLKYAVLGLHDSTKEKCKSCLQAIGIIG